MSSTSNVYPFFKNKGSAHWVFYALGTLVVLYLLSKLFIIVPAGHRVVVFNNFSGVEQGALGEGMNVLIPFVQTAYPYEVRTQTYTLSSNTSTDSRSVSPDDDSVTALTADGQKVKVDISVRYHLMPEDVWKLHQTVGQSYEIKIVRPEVRSVVRNTISQYNVRDVYSVKRDQIQAQIFDALVASFDKYHIAVDEVLIRNMSFSEAFANAIEQKQVALQEAQRMEYVLQKQKSEKERKIIEAQGEAEAIRIRAQALAQNPRLIQYEYVQKLAPNIKAIVADHNTIMNFSELMGEGKSR